MSSVRDGREVPDRMEKILRQMENMGEDTEHQQIEMLIEEKLPQELFLELCAEKEREAQWSVLKMRHVLQRLVSKREKARAMLKKRKIYHPASPKQEKSGGMVPTSALAMMKERQTEAALPCAFCNAQHRSDHCRQYNDMQARLERARELQLCFKCLIAGHMSRTCGTTARCLHCRGQHNSALCANKATTSKSEKKQNDGKVAAAVKVKEEKLSPRSSPNLPKILTAGIRGRETKKKGFWKVKETVLLPCTEAYVSAPGSDNKIKATIFLDSGSQQSFITNKLAKLLGINSRREEDLLQLATFASKKAVIHRVKKLNIELHLADGSRKKLHLSALPYLTQDLQVAQVEPKAVKKWLRTRKGSIEIKESWKQPQILIGSDYVFDILKASSTKNLSNGFRLVSSPIGYMIAGRGRLPGSKKEVNGTAKPNFIGSAICEEEGDKEDISNYWSLEFMGIKDEDNKNDDEIARKQFEETVRRSGDRYSVSWPWKSSPPNLRSNYGLCVGRLKSTVSLLRRKGLLDTYDKLFKEQLEEGIIELVSAQDSKGIIHYLPHHLVHTPGKSTTKVRMVFDASAKTGNSRSLNEVLLRGPVKLPDLCGILLRWRMMKIAIVGDVEKAFHQVELNEFDRDCTRFLWLKDLEEDVKSSNLLIYRFRRVPFGVVSSPFLLAAVLEKHLKSEGSPLSEAILRNLYVDNLLVSTHSAEEAVEVYEETKRMFYEAGMKIRGFLSNVQKFNEAIPEEERKEVDNSKVLGLKWDNRDDLIEMETKVAAKIPKTKRQLLQYVAGHFDPLGIIAPVLLPFKLFLRNLWKRRYDWDQEINEEEANQLKGILEDFGGVKFKLDRVVGHHPQNSKVHAFVDASKEAYAVAIYLRVKKEHGFQTSLIFSKTRLCPLKALTIPRLELLAVVIGCRAPQFVIHHLQQPLEAHLWSDSQCVLQWIHSKKPNPERFVENRLPEMRKSAPKFHYVPTDQNPADLATRGIRPRGLVGNQLWWHGPIWLEREENEWPNLPEGARTQCSKEVPSQSYSVMVGTNCISRTGEKTEAKELLMPSRYSKWIKYVRVMAYVLRFINMIRKRSENDNAAGRGTLTAEEIKEAEKIAIRQIQCNLEKNEEAIKKWQLYKDSEGIYRCRRRLQECIQPDPIYLPGESRVTKLIIWKCHEEVGHSGTSHTLTELWKHYWIPKGRATVKKANGECAACRRWNAKPFGRPPMPQYPKERVNRSRVFQFVGLDYLGPVTVKTAGGLYKRWVCLYTCLSTRAVHLEVVSDLTAEAFLNCFRRYVARRGAPDQIISDNAPQFKSVQQLIQDYCANRKITAPTVDQMALYNGARSVAGWSL